MKQLCWGILGCARITRRGLIPGIGDSQTGMLRALASRDIETARAWGREFHVPRAYGSYDELLGDPEVDAVYIPLPNELHERWVIAAADAGKHVLCEKPLALDSAQAARMVEHCKSRNVVLMEAFMWRHQPRTTEILEMMSEGIIGDLRLVRCSFSFPIEAGDWRLDPARGGGAHWDVGCYGVNTARLFAGSEPVSVQARTHVGPTGVDLSLAAILQFPEDILGVVDCSFEQPFRCHYELVGTKGALEVPLAYLPPGAPEARLLAPDGSTRTQFSYEAFNQYALMVDAFAGAVWQGGVLPAPAENGLSQMRVMDAVKQAAREQDV